MASRAKSRIKLDGRKYRFRAPPEIEAIGRGTLGLSHEQIDAILELQLHRLTQLSIDDILKELKSSANLSANFAKSSAATRN
jgi:DNA gyrase subunit A